MENTFTLFYCHMPIQQCCTAVFNDGPYKSYADYAGPEVIAWAEKFQYVERKHQFLSLWGFVRLHLAQAMHVDFDTIVFARTAHDKPYITSPNAHQWVFNLSHTKDYLVLCYGQHIQACGVDIEQPRQMDDMQAIVKRFYAPEEACHFESLSSQAAQANYFYRLWVIKEAVLKACGLGLSFGLHQVSLGALDAQTKQGAICLNHHGHDQRYYWQLMTAADESFPMAIAATEPFIIAQKPVSALN